MVKITIIGKPPADYDEYSSEIGETMKQSTVYEDECWGGWSGGSATKVKPTPPKPTVIGHVRKSEEKANNQLTVSIISLGNPNPFLGAKRVPQTLPQGIPVEKASEKVQTVIPGTSRKYIEVSVNELLTQFPTDKLENVTFATEILSKYCLETLSIKDCSDIGKAEKECYSDYIEQYLLISSSNRVQSSLKYMQRFNAIFKDLSDILLNQNKKVGWFGSKPKTIREGLDGHLPEINQLKDYITDAVPFLEVILEDVEQIVINLDALVEDLLSYSMVISHLLTLLPSTDKRAIALEVNGRGILDMISAIQGGAGMRAISLKSVTDLLNAINNTILLGLPAWMERITFQSANGFTETECFDLSQKLQSFIQV